MFLSNFQLVSFLLAVIHVGNDALHTLIVLRLSLVAIHKHTEHIFPLFGGWGFQPKHVYPSFLNSHSSWFLLILVGDKQSASHTVHTFDG